MKAMTTGRVLGLVLAMGLMPVGAVTLEELAARMDKMEKKLAAYEERYGPLEEAGGNPVPSPVPSPARVSGPKGGMEAPAGGLAMPEGADALDASYGMGGGSTAGGGSSWFENTTLGGYGEMHLNLGDKEEIDFHRWVLFLNHRFNERISLVSELELEHSVAGDGQEGEIELEQAYLDVVLGRGVHAKAGLFLLPLGILNETHEPETFYGTERNPIEREIIPTTWWEGGLGLTQTLENGFSWDVAVHSGLNVPTSGKDAYRIRAGREKVSEAPAMEPAVTGRLRYTGVPGLDLSVFGQFQNDITQKEGTEDNRALFGGVAGSYRRGGFGLRGLYGAWDIDGDSVATMNLDSQHGYYVEPSYAWEVGTGSRVGVFGRYNSYEAVSGEVTQYDLGVNYWPYDNVVFKADYSWTDPEGEEEQDVFNFGVGYSF